MKYLVIPALKAIWAIILCIVVTMFYMGAFLLVGLWDLELYNTWYLTRGREKVSPYAKERYLNGDSYYWYRTYYHYIFGVKSKKYGVTN